MTKAVIDKIANIEQGFSSPGIFQDTHTIRVVVDHFHTTKEHLKQYFNAIVAEVKVERNKRFWQKLVISDHQ